MKSLPLPSRLRYFISTAQFPVAPQALPIAFRPSRVRFLGTVLHAEFAWPQAISNLS
ncbi:unnamed protein product [Penicillium roqueforti FM164]|uniref:Genomic scaffold, ProqFM164S03 n=1 Tax=Penicillium roqueforti (strain FM164) TaxID=1365484 RepID=W6QCC0_PENRF|nr:unnamed protein product [Penicillium roqueforti FM164]